MRTERGVMRKRELLVEQSVFLGGGGEAVIRSE